MIENPFMLLRTFVGEISRSCMLSSLYFISSQQSFFKEFTVQHRFVISLLTADEIGIVKKISSALYENGGNIDGMSQTVVHDYFTVVLTAAFDKPITDKEIRAAIEAEFGSEDISVVVKPYRAEPRVMKSNADGRYVLTLFGKESPGILRTLTTYLAEKNINIEDYTFEIKGESVTHIGEISLPDKLDIQHIQQDLAVLLQPMDLRVSLQHENLFRATNEVCSVRQLLRGGAHV
ncbi:MAG: ACT domain-containing protein [Chitinivibrionales bacterium]|nr:ACT domain-containing protein [Chitinivibrionales bacterium]